MQFRGLDAINIYRTMEPKRTKFKGCVKQHQGGYRILLDSATKDFFAKKFHQTVIEL